MISQCDPCSCRPLHKARCAICGLQPCHPRSRCSGRKRRVRGTDAGRGSRASSEPQQPGSGCRRGSRRSGSTPCRARRYRCVQIQWASPEMLAQTHRSDTIVSRVECGGPGAVVVVRMRPFGRVVAVHVLDVGAAEGRNLLGALLQQDALPLLLDDIPLRPAFPST